jgi:hypothetical protein
MIDDDQPPSRALYRHGPRLESAAATSRRKQLLPLLAIVLIAVATSCHSNDGGEVTLTAVADPGANAFMPAPATSPPPTSTQPPPTLQPRGDGNTVETLPLPGDRDGLYGGTVNNVEVDRDKIVNFYAANTSQANSFVDTLNSDATIYWSGGTHLTVADVPRYLRELTPAVLRLDTRVTDHGFNGTHSLAKQSVFQAGNVVLVDAHGIPRVRGMSGDPLTAPIPLQGRPKLIGASWSGFHAGALAEARPATTAIGNFVLVDVATDQPFNRPPAPPAPTTPLTPRPSHHLSLLPMLVRHIRKTEIRWRASMASISFISSPPFAVAMRWIGLTNTGLSLIKAAPSSSAKPPAR